MENTLFICHRINNSNDLKTVKDTQGIELDLRDKEDKLILSHDPFRDGENFEDFLKKFNKKLIILNIKSERIEFKVLELLKKYNIEEYFFLDSTFPMIYQLNQINEQNIAIRFSEFESIESVEKVKHMVKWVWIDCFTYFPLTKEIYNKIKEYNLKICLVSPELQKHGIEKIQDYKKIIKENNFHIDAICTKYYNIHLWND